MLLPAAAVALLAGGLTAMGDLTAQVMAAIYNHCAKQARSRAVAVARASRRRMVKVPPVRVPNGPRFAVRDTLAASSARTATALARNLVAQAAYARALKRALAVLRTARRQSAKKADRAAARRDSKRLATLLDAGRQLRLQAVDGLGLGPVTLPPMALTSRQATRLVRSAQPMLEAMRAPVSTTRKLRASLVGVARRGGSFDLANLLAEPSASGYETTSSQALRLHAESL